MLITNTALPPSPYIFTACKLTDLPRIELTSLGRTADIRQEIVQVPAVAPNTISHISDPPYKYSSNKPNSSEPQMCLSTTFDSLTLTYPRTISHRTQQSLSIFMLPTV